MSTTWKRVEHLSGRFFWGGIVEADNDAAWARPLTLRTANAVYIEDCLFDYSEFGMEQLMPDQEHVMCFVITLCTTSRRSSWS